MDNSHTSPDMKSALQIAWEDAAQSASWYRAMAEAYTSSEPFVALWQSRQQQVQALAWAMEYAALAAPAPTKTPVKTLPPTQLECLEVAVVHENATVRLYESLLDTVDEPTLRDTLFQIQATLLQHHIPALRRAISETQIPDPVAVFEEIQQTVLRKNPAEWAGMLTGQNGSFLSGLLLGAAALTILSKQNTSQDDERSE
ncbi:hypothetical protein [Chrysiogenes arsenatis]|uniref:hypothetical protein n=1 Tax=Chrysiogenes arsenatis TaxID=309797 RepID=UPI000417BF8E|nr:hypothetical protein [Chrysiogenes arsenatis]